MFFNLGSYLNTSNAISYFFYGSYFRLPFPIFFCSLRQAQQTKKGFPLKSGCNVVKKSNIKFIFVKDDMSHIFRINEALSNNELICFTGDRYFEGSKFMEADLLGKTAKFPAGPFLIASRLRVPVVYVYVMKEKNLHYHLYARVAQNIKNRDSQGLLNSYVQNLESMLKKYPLQWFNYFDFWDDID